MMIHDEMSRYASLNEHGRHVIRPVENCLGGALLPSTMDA